MNKGVYKAVFITSILFLIYIIIDIISDVPTFIALAISIIYCVLEVAFCLIIFVCKRR